MNILKEVELYSLSNFPCEKIGKQWMLITSGDEKAHNTMTASWGQLGYLWNKNVATIYIRPQRYTKEFIEKNELLTLSFLPEEYREALKICGRVSGRDGDKEKEANLTPLYLDGTTTFEQSELTIVCKPLYVQQMKPELFLDKTLDENWYPQKDYHYTYVCEILKVYSK